MKHGAEGRGERNTHTHTQEAEAGSTIDVLLNTEKVLACVIRDSPGRVSEMKDGLINE